MNGVACLQDLYNDVSTGFSMAVCMDRASLDRMTEPHAAAERNEEGRKVIAELSAAAAIESTLKYLPTVLTVL